jgi:hypothetical protein
MKRSKHFTDLQLPGLTNRESCLLNEVVRPTVLKALSSVTDGVFAPLVIELLFKRLLAGSETLLWGASIDYTVSSDRITFIVNELDKASYLRQTVIYIGRNDPKMLPALAFSVLTDETAEVTGLNIEDATVVIAGLQSHMIRPVWKVYPF